MLKDQIIERLDHYIDDQTYGRSGLCELLHEALDECIVQEQVELDIHQENMYFDILHSEANRIVRTAVKDWHGYSGNNTYPIASPVFCLTAKEAYYLHAQMDKPFNLYTGIYGASRKELAKLIKTQITEEQLESIKQQLEELLS